MGHGIDMGDGDGVGVLVGRGDGDGVGVLVGRGDGDGVGVLVGRGDGDGVGVLEGVGVGVPVDPIDVTVGSSVVLGSGSLQATAATIRRTDSPPMMPRVVTPVRCLNPNLRCEPSPYRRPDALKCSQ